jgi:hypothetical protein
MKMSGIFAQSAGRGLSAAALCLTVALGIPMSASANDADAKQLLKAMADYMAAQQAITFDYDATLEVVTDEGQKLALASSGALALQRPDKIHVTRTGGFADVEMSFDGATLTLLGKNLNLYAQREIPGSLDNLVDELRVKYNRPLPAADLLLTDVYQALMHDVVDVKDLGSGVISGEECNYLAFRAKEVDWQIWISQGDQPYPCRYVITSKQIEGGPQYSIQIRNWQSGDTLANSDFSFKNATGATKVELDNLKETGHLPTHFNTGAAQ